MWNVIDDMKQDLEKERQRTGVYVFGAEVQATYAGMSADLAAYIGTEVSRRLPAWLRDIRFWESDRYQLIVQEATRSYLRYLINDYALGRNVSALADAALRAKFEQTFAKEIQFARTSALRPTSTQRVRC